MHPKQSLNNNREKYKSIIYHHFYAYEARKGIIIHFANSQCCDNPWLLKSVLSARILFISVLNNFIHMTRPAWNVQKNGFD